MKEFWETLEDFRARTESFIHTSLPAGGTLETHPNLTRKVDGEGHLLPFGGSTVVYPLPAEARRSIRSLQDALYEGCGDLLAQPLDQETFHITLHDLVSGPPSPQLEEQVRLVQPSALACVAELRGQDAPLRLVSTVLFNMVNTSMVLGFAPADEESCARLQAAYQRLQAAVRLSYPLTPHVTVAYFKPGRYGPAQIARLQAAVDLAAAQPPVSLALSGAMVEYQRFSSMGHYWNGMDE